MRSHCLLAVSLLSGGAVRAQPHPPTLADRGFPGSTLIKTDGKTAIYRLGESGSMYYFAVLRELAPTQPIIDFVDATNDHATVVARYGPEATARFTNLIVPQIGNPRSYVVNVTVYHYAGGTRLKRYPDSPGADSRHFATGQPIEPPIAKETWDGERRNSTMPFVWKGMEAESAQARSFNTLALIGGAQEKAATAVANRERVRDSVFRKEAGELEARRARGRAREAERRSLITAAGLNYLPPEEWARYRLGPEFRAVFDGAWPNAAREWEFGAIYWRTIKAYSDRCRRLIPRGSPMEITKRFETDEFGRDRPIGSPDTIFIPVAFAAPFEWWDRRAPEALPLAPPGLEPRDIDGAVAALVQMATNIGAALSATALVAKVHARIREDLPLLFAGGCESPLLTQFMDNMRLLALRRPTLQAARAPRSIPTAAEWPLSVGAACRRGDDERRSSSPTGWCDCLDRAAAAQMTLGDRWLAMEDYQRFFDEVLGTRTGADGRPVPERQAILNACQR